MSNSFTLLPRCIIAQISLLLCLFLFSYAGQKIGHSLLEQRQDYLHSLLKNEHNKLEFSYILQQNLLAINVKLHEMSSAGSKAEIDHILKILQGLQTEILEILKVIEIGGEKKITYSVNFGNEEEVSRNLNYINHSHRHFDLEIIELRAKLAELENIIADFKVVVEDKITVLDSNDPLQIALIDRKVSNYFKGIEPFFSRILENSYRLYFTGQKEAERFQKINDKFRQTYTRVENALVTGVIAFVLLMGWVVLRSSKKILLERQNYQKELQETNENLENIVHKRTSALEKEASDRKSAELQVKKHADFLYNIIESLAHPFYVIDADDYTVVLANSAAMGGANPSCKTCYDLTHQRDTPCDGSDHPCPLQRVKETLSPVVMEHIHRNSQGEQIIVEVHGYPVFDASGNLKQMIEYSLDVTAKKKAEKALQLSYDQLEETVRKRTRELEEQILQKKEAQLTLIKSERHYRRLIENVSDIITILDEDGKVTYTSPSAETLLGVPPEKLIGVYVGDLVLTEDLRNIDISTLHERHSGTTPMEYRLRDRYGKVHVLESYIQKFQQDDDTTAYVLYSRDITIRKRAEEETRNLKMIVEQSPSSIVMTDTEGTIEYVNPAFEQITGYSFTEAVGLNPRVLKSGHTPEPVFRQLWATIKAGKVWQGEFVNKKKNGELYDENVLVLPIKNNDKITHFVALKENITELKKARRQAEKANQAKSNFLSHMSHELRTPLNAINGFSQLMLKSKKNPLNPKQQNMAAQINIAGQHLLQLINEVLDLARIESGEFTLSIEPLDPHSFIDDCLSLTSSLAKDKSITIIKTFADKDLPFVRADLTRVKQILLNLLSNSVKYNKLEGTVTIDVDMGIPGFLCFSVTDTGIGIPEERQKDLFVPFTRALDDPNEIEGTGIGMTISKQLVEKMGGEIGFESEREKGSRFWFTLPVSVTHLAPKNTVHHIDTDKDPVSAVTSHSQKLVLYVEDEPTNITFMQDFFHELENFQLITATTGEQGASLALKNPPDLILMDLNLPDIDGFQVYRRIKSNPETEFIPVVAVSADAMEKTIKRVHRMGFDGYISKPVDVDFLYKTMTDLLKD
ncbi:PAS domain S-box protein [uncultured Desulfuromusa sp.]|uniref:PAS domain S-box protein n=1 Tax=uncultured Desulfuromusa sp. TaxID=219183 RepID=UPI002AA8F490|nr:PAS domain S-box protein [uncultured Desulfuromusa sp.]